MGVFLIKTARIIKGSVLISFGVILGKSSPVQMVLMAIAEVFFYSLNEVIFSQLATTDIGGSMVIHTFGAFFGLSCARTMSSLQRKSSGSPDNSAVYHSDLFAMVSISGIFLRLQLLVFKKKDWNNIPMDVLAKFQWSNGRK